VGIFQYEWGEDRTIIGQCIQTRVSKRYKWRKSFEMYIEGRGTALRRSNIERAERHYVKLLKWVEKPIDHTLVPEV